MQRDKEYLLVADELVLDWTRGGRSSLWNKYSFSHILTIVFNIYKWRKYWLIRNIYVLDALHLYSKYVFPYF